MRAIHTASGGAHGPLEIGLAGAALMELGQLAGCGEQAVGEAHGLLLAGQHLLVGMEVVAEVGKAALTKGPEGVAHRWARLDQHLGVDACSTSAHTGWSRSRS